MFSFFFFPTLTCESQNVVRQSTGSTNSHKLVPDLLEAPTDVGEPLAERLREKGMNGLRDLVVSEGVQFTARVPAKQL
jgi:hypothetical protein